MTDGFVDTGDMLILRDGRYHFTGRREGVINVGGSESASGRSGSDRQFASECTDVTGESPRRSPITGAIVIADIVLENSAAGISFLQTKDESFG